MRMLAVASNRFLRRTIAYYFDLHRLNRFTVAACIDVDQKAFQPYECHLLV